MESNNNISPLFTFAGRCFGGMTNYSILPENERIGGFWAKFAADCKDLDNSQASHVRLFLSVASQGEPAAMLEEQGQDFLLSTYSLHRWFLFWKNLDLPIKDYVRRRIVYISIYAVRYCIDNSEDNCVLGQKLIDYIYSKELATFIIDEWTGNGLVGLTTTSDGNRTVMKEFCFQNEDLAGMYRDYFESGVATNRTSEFNSFAESFEESLGEMAVNLHQYGDFSEVTLLHQASYYRQKYLTEPFRVQKALRHIVGFYRFIVNTEQGCNIFAEGNFSASLLRSMTVLRYLSEGWDFCHYLAIEPSESRSRLVVVLKDMHRLGTRYNNGDAIAFDLSSVERPYYRNILWRYIRSNRSVLTAGSDITYISEALHLMEENRKQQSIKVTHLFAEDVDVFRAFCLEKTNIQDTTVKYILSTLRRFFTWTDKQQLITAENGTIIECLKYRVHGNTSSTRGKAMPRADYDRIIGRMAMEGERDYRAKLIYVIVYMLSVTRFRPSQICNMDIRSLRLVKNKDYCIIKGMTKVSRGDKASGLATLEIYEMLSSLLEESAEMRETCYDRDIKDFIFLYRTANGFDRIREADVKQALERACDTLELPHWTPYSLRKMYATIWDELDRLLGYHGELAAQAMGHKNYKTTRENYIDRSFEEFRRLEDADQISTDEMLLKEFQIVMQGGNV